MRDKKRKQYLALVYNAVTIDLKMFTHSYILCLKCEFLQMYNMQEAITFRKIEWQFVKKNYYRHFTNKTMSFKPKNQIVFEKIYQPCFVLKTYLANNSNDSFL